MQERHCPPINTNVEQSESTLEHTPLSANCLYAHVGIGIGTQLPFTTWLAAERHVKQFPFVALKVLHKALTLAQIYLTES